MRYAIAVLLFWTVPASAQVVTRSPEWVARADAEARASRWWSQHYRGTPNQGAAWYMENRCYVGICDGRSAQPGEVRGAEAVPGGGWRNISWLAEHPSPTGGYYKNIHWTGYGDTWDEAFYDAMRRGFAPIKKGKMDLEEEARFLKAIGKPPIKRVGTW